MVGVVPNQYFQMGNGFEIRPGHVAVVDSVTFAWLEP